MRVAIWWIRRDIRLDDNQALTAALSQADVIVPLFILDPHLLGSSHASPARNAFLFDGLRLLEAELRQLGSSLVMRQGDPIVELQRVYAELNASAIFAEADISPYARQRDNRLQRLLPLHLSPGRTVHPSDTLLKPDGSPYTVFSAFSSRWKSLPFSGKQLFAPAGLTHIPAMASLELPVSVHLLPARSIIAGEREAKRRLEAFVDADIYGYAQGRDRMDLDSTSNLSPYLRFGMLSARQAVLAAQRAIEIAPSAAARASAESWLNELVWREFYASILDHFPQVLHTAFQPGLRVIPWRDDADGLAAWADGRTGHPIIDAGMRQLMSTGWMHNRARMLTASFLVKDLLVDWRAGEAYFMQHLLDGDPASNNGGWQWTAGTGTDAAPYFRVFNPLLQARKFDPRGGYVRRWVPELSNVPDEYIHTPWSMPVSLQMQVGCVIGKNYPAPIIDHEVARQRVLEAYRRGKNERSL